MCHYTSHEINSFQNCFGLTCVLQCYFLRPINGYYMRYRYFRRLQGSPKNHTMYTSHITNLVFSATFSFGLLVLFYRMKYLASRIYYEQSNLTCQHRASDHKDNVVTSQNSISPGNMLRQPCALLTNMSSDATSTSLSRYSRPTEHEPN